MTRAKLPPVPTGQELMTASQLGYHCCNRGPVLGWFFYQEANGIRSEVSYGTRLGCWYSYRITNWGGLLDEKAHGSLTEALRRFVVTN